MINAALTRPTRLGLPFACWTLDRLVAYLSEQGIAMRRSRISEIVLQEGLKWRHEGGSRRDPRFGARVDLTSREKGRSSSSTRRLADSVVVCLDEMGPQASKSYPGQRLVKPAGPKAERAKQEIDHGRRDKAGYVFGALQPATGKAFTLTYERRTTVNGVDFLSAVEGWIDPAVERVHAVVDNLNIHSAPDVLLFGLLHPRWGSCSSPNMPPT